MTRILEPGQIVVATHNAGKLAEINDLIAPFGFSAKSSAELGLEEPEETGTTFEENASIKALAAMKATGMPALADDSGLCVTALDNDPGVYTADWAEKPDGSGRDFMMAMEKIEGLLQKQQATDRSARFVAVLCLAWPDGHMEFFRGEVEGTLVWPPRGELGFGYDPVFQPEGHETTFGEMTPEQKHGWETGQQNPGLSHRARAFASFATQCLTGKATR